MIRDPEERAARAVVKRFDAQRRKERKANKANAMRAVIESVAPGKRQPREEAPPYRAWLRRQPCAICEGKPCDAAHLRFNNPDAGRMNPGAGRKSHDRHSNPLCRRHHTEQHDAGDEAAWWASYGLDGDASAARHYAAFLAGQPQARPIPSRAFAKRPSASELGQDSGTARELKSSRLNHKAMREER